MRRLRSIPSPAIFSDSSFPCKKFFSPDYFSGFRVVYFSQFVVSDSLVKNIFPLEFFFAFEKVLKKTEGMLLLPLFPERNCRWFGSKSKIRSKLKPPAPGSQTSFFSFGSIWRRQKVILFRSLPCVTRGND